MEDHQSLSFEISNICESESKFNLEWSQGYKDSQQLENRIRILEIEKQRKIKDIEKKLNQHRRNIELKILKHDRHQAVQNLHEQERLNVTSYYNRFQTEKKKRDDNIKNLRIELTKTKNQQFWNVKKQSEEIERKINEQKMLQKQEKVKKRNRVRLMEIQSKENLVNGWNRRINEMKESRQRTIDKKLKQHQFNLSSMAKMSQKQRKILEEIYKAEDMEKQLGEMILDETRMSGQQLSHLYTMSV